jgi:hypothetical protein
LKRVDQPGFGTRITTSATFRKLELLKKTFIHAPRFAAFAAIWLLVGCGTSFKYNPNHGRSYPTVSNGLGVEIAGGIDQRPDGEKCPEWTRKVEVIVANALADEIKHDGLFQRVKIHLRGPARLNKFSYYIQFQVEAFEMAPRTGTAEQIGRTALDAMGWRGGLISASIPTTWQSQVKIQFEVFDAPTKQAVFSRSYSETRSLRANGYQGKSRQIQQTSDCLEAVLQRFTRDFSQWLPANRPPSTR